MFTFTGIAKVAGVLLALVFVGMALVPTEILFVVLGGLCLLAGVVSLFVAPYYALLLVPLGAGMLIFGLRLQRRLEREQLAEAEDASRRVSGLMDVHIPRDQ